jgi:hypothetical protein
VEVGGFDGVDLGVAWEEAGGDCAGGRGGKGVVVDLGVCGWGRVGGGAAGPVVDVAGAVPG